MRRRVSREAIFFVAARLPTFSGGKGFDTCIDPVLGTAADFSPVRTALQALCDRTRRTVDMKRLARLEQHSLGLSADWLSATRFLRTGQNIDTSLSLHSLTAHRRAFPAFKRGSIAVHRKAFAVAPPIPARCSDAT
jgi:hypothetical protein